MTTSSTDIATRGTTASRSEAQCKSAGGSGLYLSARDQGWTPPGCRIGKGWDVCAVGTASAARYLGSWAKDSTVVEAIGWFDDEGAARVIVADLEGGRRVIIRLLATTTKLTFSRWGAPR